MSEKILLTEEIDPRPMVEEFLRDLYIFPGTGNIHDYEFAKSQFPYNNNDLPDYETFCKLAAEYIKV